MNLAEYLADFRRDVELIGKREWSSEQLELAGQAIAAVDRRRAEEAADPELKARREKERDESAVAWIMEAE